jgi:acetylornithine deacetylase/succinyl-diaminopimelate desuccinylase-like protein
VADLDCRVLRGDAPDEIVDWVRGVIADERVEVSLINPPPKIPNSSPPDTPLYKALAAALGRRAPGVVVAPDVLVGFTDNWVFRNCGLHGYGFSPFLVDEDEGRRVHGNDERISLENLREGVRCHTEMLLDVAAA